MGCFATDDPYNHLQMQESDDSHRLLERDPKTQKWSYYHFQKQIQSLAVHSAWSSTYALDQSPANRPRGPPLFPLSH